jgi:hypothetical protein
VAVDDAVGVLDLGDIDQVQRALDRRPIDVGEPDQIQLALLAQSLKLAELVLERDRRAGSRVDQAQVHQVQPLHP